MIHHKLIVRGYCKHKANSMQPWWVEINMMHTKIFAKTFVDDVNAVIAEGSHLDEWKSCLFDDAWPEGIRILDADVTLVSIMSAYSTCIEFPASINGAVTLLAVKKQTWSSSSGPQMLVKHQTIPWVAENTARGMLICDCCGCVLLVWSPGWRVFGGLIG